MTGNDIAHTRLQNQQVSEPSFKTVKELVGYMGAMQAQDYAMAKWAVGARLPHVTDAVVEEAIAKADIIRTHVMRPTWHFVSSDDIYWILELTAPQIKAITKSWGTRLGLGPQVLAKSHRLMAKALEGGKQLTREVLMQDLKQADIDTNEFRASHLLMEAELIGLICNGSPQGKQQTYALLEERVPNKKLLPKEEALAELARRYFTSHGPATLKDFVWWSGLYVTDAKKAIAMVQSELASETINDVTYWFRDSLSEGQKAVHLLPAFDEYLISYKDRSASLAPEHGSKAASNNGIFWPIIVIDGQVTGLWKRTVKKDKVLIETKPFQPLNQKTKALIHKSAEKFAKFLEKKAEVVPGEK